MKSCAKIHKGGVAMERDEHIEYINSELKLIVSTAHTFGTDALLLAHFARPDKNAKICDLGTGCGIIPFRFLSEGLGSVIFAVDIMPAATDLLKKSVELNGIEEKIVPICADLRELNGRIPMGLDMVTMNPPYTESGGGIPPRDSSARTARHEEECSLDEICRSAARLLRFGGSLCMCNRPSRLFGMMMAMRENGIEPKRLRLVSKKDGSAPWLVLLEGKKGRKPGMVIEPELHIYVNGEYSDEMKEITAQYKKAQEERL